MSAPALRRVATNGIELEIREQGAGPLVLLLHGFPESGHSFRHQMPALAAAGFRAVAPNQRGYGRSDRPDAIDAYDQVTLAADVAGLIDALGERQAILVGHDWGAAVAWNAALLHPDRVRAVAAMSVPYGGRTPIPPLAILRSLYEGRFFYMLYFQTPGVAEAELGADLRRMLRMMLYSASGDAPEEGAGAAFRGASGAPAGLLETLVDPARLPAWLTEADLDSYTADFVASGLRGPLNWYRNLDRTWELTAALAGAEVRQPALFIAGDRDPVYGWTRGQLARMSSLVPGLKGPIVLSGCGHWMQQERPDEVNQILLEFLRDLS